MFFRLDALFGGRQNVLPAFVMQSSDSQSTETAPALTQFIDLIEDGSDYDEVSDMDVNEQSETPDDREVANMLFNMGNSNIVGHKRDAIITHESFKQNTKRIKGTDQASEKTVRCESSTSKIECSNKVAQSLATKIIDNKKGKRDFSSCYVETKSKSFCIVKSL
jgi:hypothetical protein